MTQVQSSTQNWLLTGQRFSTIFFDLDGVLLDVSERHYQLYRDVVESLGGQTLDKASYWGLKRERQPLRALLGENGSSQIDEEAFRREWMLKIESPAYLQYDSVIAGAREQLQRLKQARQLVLVTLRQRRECLDAQLQRLNLRGYFAAVLSTPAPATREWEAKQGLIDQSGFRCADALFVGDTEVDVRAGKAVGAKTVAVLSGLRSYQSLAAERPDVIVDDIGALSILSLQSEE
jgi:phosphoglycolate phosphatase